MEMERSLSVVVGSPKIAERRRTRWRPRASCQAVSDPGRARGCGGGHKRYVRGGVSDLRLGRRERRAARRNGEGLHVRLPLSGQLEELDAVPFGAVDEYCRISTLD